MKKLAFILILFFVVKTDFLLAQTATNVNGTWIMNVETSAGSGSPTFVLEHVDSTNLKGTYTGQLGDFEVKGTLNGNIIYLEFSISGEIIEYNGTVTGNEMKGKVKLGTMAEGTFTGKKKE
ncbi:hypothetical protein MMU07_11765 [Aquiflexum sp. LQ15W]|uniref:hypothetical protein n=1 Tax=Cognataquiflexum nitidum TaxID=2922272 RepID=UPI001F13D754|nr:hypothetical protein [Cognataquiflexum nitidum]MCH6200258.1 hypothetical protein [Cognataquiflexum nitidum]